MKNKELTKGFTLVEVVVTLAVVAILSAIMIPLISNNIESARVTKAGADTKSIMDAIVKFRYDLAKWPVYNNAGVSHNLLYGKGNRNSSWESANPKLSLHFSLVVRPNFYNLGPSKDGTPAWNGPYVSEVKQDSWGNAYLVNSQFLGDENRRVWVISGGQDNTISTPFNGLTDPPTGDDIYQYLK